MIINPDFEDDGENYWVIPHGASLDYCPVTIISEPFNGKAMVAGRRTAGWIKDGAQIKARVPIDKLTNVPEWHGAFLGLYDDPHYRQKSY